MPTTYEILEGVKRAKAFELHDMANILARIDDDGQLSPPILIAVADLRSPHKAIIDLSSSSSEAKKWDNILQGIRNRVAFPPIEVVIGSRGPPIKDIDVIYSSDPRDG